MIYPAPFFRCLCGKLHLASRYMSTCPRCGARLYLDGARK